MQSLMMISVLVGFVLAGCSMSNREPPGDTKNVPQADADADFGKSWHGHCFRYKLRQNCLKSGCAFKRVES